MIQIQNYNKEKQKLVFATDMPISLANAIRRSVLEIPIMAIDEVEIFKNDSALYDEIIAHRLGLVPIKTSKTSKETKFKLKAKGPCTVYSTDISPSAGTEYKIPITILDEGQEIEIVANAKLGLGIEHVKHSPGLIYYRHDLDPKILDFVSIDESGEISYDEKELERKGVSQEDIDKIKKLSKTIQLKFSIESWGQIEVKEIFKKSIEVLDKNLEKLDKAAK